MKRPFGERWLLARTIWADYRRRHDEALDLLRQLERRRPLSLRELGIKAHVLLRAMRPEDAHDLFLAIREQVKDRSDPAGRYIRHYAQFWLAMIRWDPFNAGEQSRAARAVDCSPGLKRQMRVLELDSPTRLEAEFDAWMKANPPGEGDLRKRPAGP